MFWRNAGAVGWSKSLGLHPWPWLPIRSASCPVRRSFCVSPAGCGPAASSANTCGTIIVCSTSGTGRRRPIEPASSRLRVDAQPCRHAASRARSRTQCLARNGATGRSCDAAEPKQTCHAPNDPEARGTQVFSKHGTCFADRSSAIAKRFAKFVCSLTLRPRPDPRRQALLAGVEQLDGRLEQGQIVVGLASFRNLAASLASCDLPSGQRTSITRRNPRATGRREPG